MVDKPTTAEIRERHDYEDLGHLYLQRDILGQAHKDRDILLDRLKTAEQTIRDIGAVLAKRKCTSICTEPPSQHTTANKLEKAGVPCLFCEIEKALLGNHNG